MSVTEIATGLRFPEGPVAMPDGSFLLVEIARRTVSRVSAKGEVSVVSETGGGPNGLAIGKDKAGYVCNNGGFEFFDDELGTRPSWQAHDYSHGRLERVDLATGKVSVLTRGLVDRGLRGPNDLVVDRRGGIWFTDLGKRRPREMDWGGIYWLSPDGRQIKQVAYPFLTANGIGLSPDEKTVYVAETEGARLWAFDVTGPGEVRHAPYPSPHGGRLVHQSGGTELKRFDSLAVEASGNICVATLATGGVSVISPAGELVEFVPMPDRMCTNICFGGPELKTAYMTLSLSGRLVSMPWKRPGLPLNFLESVTIRAALPEDGSAIHRLVALAFGREDEAVLVDVLRADGDVLAELVAIVGGEIVGHVLLSPLLIEGDAGRLRLGALAPLAVLPGHQRQGIGAALVRELLARAAALGLPAVVVLGDPAYYGRFGFRAELAAAIATPFTGPHLMAVACGPEVPVLRGRGRYARAFGIE